MADGIPNILCHLGTLLARPKAADLKPLTKSQVLGVHYDVLGTGRIFDSWWGYFGPALMPVDVVLGATVNNSGAVEVEGGLNMPLARTCVKVFVEARYFKGFTSKTDTTVVPITLGVPS